MNERIKELAKQAGFDVEERTTGGGDVWFDEGWYTEIVERFAELVRQDEREACAKLLDTLAESQTNQSLLEVSDCAAAIRARGDKHE